jgi:signal transduction histidine kinase
LRTRWPCGRPSRSAPVAHTRVIARSEASGHASRVREASFGEPGVLLGRLEQQRDEYLALISHDLRSPLASVALFLENLRGSLATASRAGIRERWGAA